MEKLNELEMLADEAIASSIYSLKVKVSDILAIVEAFRELEKRAEAEEANLAEMEKQEPAEYQYYYHNHGTGTGQWLPVTSKQDYDRMKAKHAGDNDFSFRELFTSPAPAINLADLVPDEMPNGGSGSPTDSVAHWCDGYNSCRAAILRKIGEAK